MQYFQNYDGLCENDLEGAIKDKETTKKLAETYLWKAYLKLKSRNGFLMILEFTFKCDTIGEGMKVYDKEVQFK